MIGLYNVLILARGLGKNSQGVASAAATIMRLTLQMEKQTFSCLKEPATMDGSESKRW
eukprot:CAMPEP_0206505636 /NCGR_PEP_ID=MMETSP0324_2-20121206/56258_1 /ASSEMBLY_ACC=CAM_ASM_000836 /TAXON_ID=2866 /ORGANISM="Crypthecodinium cohnii, Strain Seligo" /LENGTH=57 /DNA_ID=CAMNT_0053995153 /DNA_START=547 /DNA_END=720 /DNA_ORIENTATION=-